MDIESCILDKEKKKKKVGETPNLINALTLEPKFYG